MRLTVNAYTKTIDPVVNAKKSEITAAEARPTTVC
jgi:hypothetical protein